ncbi:MAG: hypothetical protein HY225_00385 [Candidatus Vogelbacteria bacterium]|nr:hypothetical protein [Candidatus Vogelbacteria bacterium]
MGFFSVKRFIIFWVSVFFLFEFLSPMAFADSTNISCDTINDGDSQEVLQTKLNKCESDIKEQSAMLKAKELQSTNLERDLTILGYKINQSQLEIKARNISILNLDRNIDEKGQAISDLLDQIDRLKVSTAELIKKTNEVESASLVEVILTSKNISDFYQDLGAFDSLEASIGNAVVSINKNKSTEEEHKKDLQNKQDKERELKALQEIDKRKQEVVQVEKNRIFKESKGQEKKYKEILAQKQKLINDIKNKILKITGGGELTFAEALKLVRVAERAIGVRAAFILSILTQESGMDGVIGKDVGRCFYNTPWNNLSATVMSNTQKPSYFYILQNLGKDPNTTPVSCPISRDGQYGGAMGPSQFMPKTWWDIDAQTGYKNRVQSITGSAFASPFDNLDSFTATALYLDDALSGCEEIYKTQALREKCAAAKYYAGANWKRHLNGYGANVAYRAAEFQKDIDTLDSQ